jgi:DNA-binding beta-propeller fold protein YncE
MGGELYVAVGDPGSVTVVDTSALEVVESIATEDGAHTLCWDPIHETLYVFCPGSGGAALFTRQGGRS